HSNGTADTQVPAVRTAVPAAAGNATAIRTDSLGLELRVLRVLDLSGRSVGGSALTCTWQGQATPVQLAATAPI
ncbi:MAG: hypothetical protein ACHP7K_10790, partial [Actinomycetales bacterium]